MATGDVNSFLTKQTHDKLMSQLADYLETTEFALSSIDTIETKSNVSLVSVSINMLVDKCDLDYVNSLIIKHHNNKNYFNVLNTTVVQVEMRNFCNNQTVVFQTAIKKTRFFNMDEDFLMAILVPGTIIGSMLIVSIILACVLYKKSRKYYESTDMEPLSPIYKKPNKAYLSKGVPVILYEEMGEKQTDEDVDSNGSHLKPLIMRDEKPPAPPAPPEYCKFASAFDSFSNGVVDAPLAQSEFCNDDSFNLIQQQHKRIDESYYQPPKPITDFKEVQKRTHHVTTKTECAEQSTNILP
jgi:hypothetical protein